MSKMFRRIRSPREKDDKPSEKDAAGASRTYSQSGHLQSHVNHRRHKSDEVQTVQTVQNAIYSEPVVSSSVGANGRGTGGAALLDEGPPLPPRNRPASIGNANQLRKQMSADDDSYYVAPVDTLRNRRGVVNPAVVGDRGAVLTRSERKQMQIHEMTQSQKQVHGHRRTGSFGHVIDNSEYSTPWNVLQEQKEIAREREKRQKAAAVPAETTPLEPEVQAEEKQQPSPVAVTTQKPPDKPQRVSNRTKRAVIQQSLQNHDTDVIIPVHSPSPVLGSHESRSQNSSPTSPPVSDNPPGSPQEAEGDYDEPWDRKKVSRGFHHLSRTSRHGGQPGKWPQDGPGGDDQPIPPPSVSPVSGSQRQQHYSPRMREKFPHDSHGRGTSPQPESAVKLTEGDRTSPPRGGGEMRVHKYKSERTRRPSPQPEFRSVHVRSASERSLGGVGGGRDHRGDASTPLATETRARAATSVTVVDQIRDISTRSHSDSKILTMNSASEGNPLSSSPEATPRAVSQSVPISRRKLPSPPLGTVDQFESRRYTQSSTAAPMCDIDVALPLHEQP